MIKPTRDDVAVLAGYDEERFARWLLQGLHGYLDKPGEGRHAFGPMKTFIGIEPDLVQDIVNLYKLLTASEQIRFRAGLATALARTTISSQNLPILEHLLNLATEVGAAEILPILSDKHRMAWLTKASNDEDLFATTLHCAEILTTNAGDTLQAAANLSILRDFAASNLPTEYAEPLFLSMCRVRPLEAWLNFLDLRRYLDDEFGPVEDKEADKLRATWRKGLIDRAYDIMGDHAFRQMLADAVAATPTDYRREWWVMTALAHRRDAFAAPAAKIRPEVPSQRAAARVAGAAPVTSPVGAFPIPRADNDTEEVYEQLFQPGNPGPASTNEASGL